MSAEASDQTDDRDSVREEALLRKAVAEMVPLVVQSSKSWKGYNSSRPFPGSLAALAMHYCK